MKWKKVLALVFLLVVFSSTSVFAQSFSEEKGLFEGFLEWVGLVDPVAMDVKVGEDIVDGSSKLVESWASIEVSPSVAFSLPKVRNFTQNIKVCNLASDEGYLYFNYFFDKPLKYSSLTRWDKWVESKKVVNPIVKCTSVGEYPNNSTYCYEDDSVEVYYQDLWHEKKTPLESFDTHEWGSKANYVKKQGELFGAGECKEYILNYQPAWGENEGKWNFQVWGNKEDDWSCIETESCPYSYTLDPTFSSAFTYKRMVTVSNTGASINNMTVYFNFTANNTLNTSHVQGDGDDVIFVNFDETQQLGCYKEVFDNTSLMNWSVIIPNFTNSTPTVVWMYYGNATMDNQCPEINNAYLLADQMNSSSINTTIWNQKVSTQMLAGGATKGYYEINTTAGQFCQQWSGSTYNTQECNTFGNFSGVLKSSQSFTADAIILTTTPVNGCGMGQGMGNASGTYNQTNLGNVNMSWTSDDWLQMRIKEANVDIASSGFVGRDNLAHNYSFTSFGNDYQPLAQWWNNSGSGRALTLFLTGSKSSVSYLNNSVAYGFGMADGSGGVACNLQFHELRIRGYNNATPTFSFASETTVVNPAINLTINNQTWETTGLLDAGGVSNYSINVTWDSNTYNNISAVNFSIGDFTYRDSQITNVTIGNQTRFNISVYTPLVEVNNTSLGFNWSFTQTGNGTNVLTANSTNITQSVSWGWFVNNFTYVSPIISGRLNNVLVNFTKLVPSGLGMAYNVSLEWNQTNRTLGEMLTNVSGYEEWNTTFVTPVVLVQTSVQMKGWLNLSFNGSFVTRDPNATQVIVPVSVNATTVWENPVTELSEANFSVNVTWDANDVNNITNINFTYNNTVFIGGILNTTGLVGGNIRWTNFNITLRPNLTQTNASNYNFTWNFTVDTNVSNLSVNTSTENQTILFGSYINNVTWTTPILEGTSNGFNIRRHTSICELGIPVTPVMTSTIEYNGTNQSAVSEPIYVGCGTEVFFNTMTMTSPLVDADVSVPFKAWMNLSFNGVSLQRNFSNSTQRVLNTTFNVVYSNFVNNGSYDFVRNLSSQINFTCSGNASLHRIIDGVLNQTYDQACTLGGDVFNNSYIHSVEWNYTIRWDLIVNNVSNFTSTARNFISDLYNPVVVQLNITTNSTSFNGSAVYNVSMTCADNVYNPLNYTMVLNSNLIFNNTKINNTQQLNQTSLPIGANILTGTCADPFGSTTSVVNSTFFFKILALIDEVNNIALDVSNLTSVRVYQDDNSTFFDFKTANVSTINYTSINNTRLRFELIYSSGAVITRYIDVSLVNATNLRVCGNLEGVTHFEQLITSALVRPITLLSIFANCYVAADYTRFAFQDRKVLKAFTIQHPYYLNTVIVSGAHAGEQVLIASLDGSIPSEINLDVLELIATPYDFSILQSALTFQHTGANQVTIFYANAGNDNVNGTLVITDITSNIVLFNSSAFTNPNNWTLVFDFTTFNLSNSTMFQLLYEANTTGGIVKSTKTYFNGRGNSGVLNNAIAAIVAVLFLLFGLSITTARVTFAWFGVLVCIATFVILTLAVGGVWYITFLQAINAIVLVYIVINLVKQGGDVLT